MSDEITELDRLKSALSRLVRMLDGRRTFFGLYEYRIVTDDGDSVSCSPADDSIGLPGLTKIPKRPSITGDKSTLPPGSTIVIGFLDGNPAKPFACFGDPNHQALSIELGGSSTIVTVSGGARPAAASGDFAGPFPIVGTAVKVLV